MNHPAVSIVITTYNGRELLLTLLPQVERAAEFFPGESEIILVDDAGTDGSDEFVRQNFPGIKNIRLEKNIGPLDACNRGFQECQNPVIILLDNDVAVAEDFIQHLVRHFDRRDVFAVRPSYKIDPRADNNSLTVPRLLGKFKFGLIYPNIAGISRGDSDFAFTAGGGGCAFDRKKLLELGSFDRIFSPFYYEDTDISYRALKRGWKIIFEPRSLVFHVGTGTINRFHSVSYITMICERNRFLLVWKHISDPWFIIRHLFFIPIRLLYYLVKLRLDSVAGFFCALPYIKEVMKKRGGERKFVRVSDKEIFDMFR